MLGQCLCMRPCVRLGLCQLELLPMEAEACTGAIWVRHLHFAWRGHPCCSTFACSRRWCVCLWSLQAAEKLTSTFFLSTDRFRVLAYACTDLRFSRSDDLAVELPLAMQKDLPASRGRGASACQQTG